MGGKKAPKPPKPQSGNAYNYETDPVTGQQFLRSSSIYNPKSKSFETQSFQSPSEIEAGRQQRDFYNATLSDLVNGAKGREQKYQTLSDEYKGLGEKEITKSFNKALNDQTSSFNQRGLLSSTGYEDLRNNQLESAKASDLADNAFKAKQLGTDALRAEENQLLAKLGFASGEVQQGLGNALRYGDFGRQLYAQGYGTQADYYNNRLKQFQLNRQAADSTWNKIIGGVQTAAAIGLAPFTGGATLPAAVGVSKMSGSASNPTASSVFGASSTLPNPFATGNWSIS